MTLQILIINGPNLNTLGTREPTIYGTTTLIQINEALRKHGEKLGASIDTFQSNHEGVLIDHIQQCSNETDGIIINPGAFTHYAIAIRDALVAAKNPVIEVHLSNIYAREPFRRESIITPITRGYIGGLGWKGYLLALEALVEIIHEERGKEAPPGSRVDRCCTVLLT